MLRRATSVVALASLALVGVLGATSGTPVPAAPGGVALLTSVTAQNMGDFDRVTFGFEGGTPTILGASYSAGPAVQNPSGLPVTPPVAGNVRLLITMGNASGINLFVNPPVTTYTGPTRFSPGLPKVVELVEVEDFEATLGWVIGIAGGGPEARAQVLSDPTRVVVDIPHIAVVTVQPSFTG